MDTYKILKEFGQQQYNMRMLRRLIQNINTNVQESEVPQFLQKVRKIHVDV
jgi:hypothetical protein